LTSRTRFLYIYKLYYDIFKQYIYILYLMVVISNHKIKYTYRYLQFHMMVELHHSISVKRFWDGKPSFSFTLYWSLCTNVCSALPDIRLFRNVLILHQTLSVATATSNYYQRINIIILWKIIFCRRPDDALTV